MPIKLSTWQIVCVVKEKVLLKTTDLFPSMKWTQREWLSNRITTLESTRCYQMLLNSKCLIKLKWAVSNHRKPVNYLLISRSTTVILLVKTRRITKVIKQIKIILMLMKLSKRIEKMGIIIESVLPLLTELLLNNKFLIYQTKEKLQTLINNRWWWRILSLTHLKIQLEAIRSQRI